MVLYNEESLKLMRLSTESVNSFRRATATRQKRLSPLFQPPVKSLIVIDSCDLSGCLWLSPWQTEVRVRTYGVMARSNRYGLEAAQEDGTAAILGIPLVASPETCDKRDRMAVGSISSIGASPA